MTLPDMIARLEAATEGSQELDEAIGYGYFAQLYYEWWRARKGPSDFTQSIDAALTLLPEWASFELQQSAARPPTFTRCRLHDWHRSPKAADPHNEWMSEGNRPLPLNICIAALKARAATDPNEPDRSRR